MKEFQNITKKQIEQNGVQALSDRPNSVGAYGSGGLSPLELKLAFDRLATLIAEKINEIHKVLAGDEAGQYISVHLQKHGIDNLGALVDTIESGKLAEIMQLTPSAGVEKKENLQDIIFSLARSLAEAQEALRNIDDIKSALKEIEWIKEEIEKIPQFSEKDPTVPDWAKQPNPPAESDPTVPDWAKQASKPTYKWDEIEEKPDNIGGGSENAVEYTAQTLTENQKTQARTNIAAAPAYTYSATDITAGGASIGEGRLHFVYE